MTDRNEKYRNICVSNIFFFLNVTISNFIYNVRQLLPVRAIYLSIIILIVLAAVQDNNAVAGGGGGGR